MAQDEGDGWVWDSKRMGWNDGTWQGRLSSNLKVALEAAVVSRAGSASWQHVFGGDYVGVFPNGSFSKCWGATECWSHSDETAEKSRCSWFRDWHFFPLWATRTQSPATAIPGHSVSFTCHICSWAEARKCWSVLTAALTLQSSSELPLSCSWTLMKAGLDYRNSSLPWGNLAFIHNNNKKVSAVAWI